MRRATLLLVLATLLALPGSALARSHASLTDIENDLMCTSCHEPLAVAQSPQAYSERAYVKQLIAEGETKAQIERNMVAQYGPSVLGRPPARGFNLTVYVLPPAIVVLGLVLLAVALPRWRRRTRAAPASVPAAALSGADARRLDEDLASFGG